MRQATIALLLLLAPLVVADTAAGEPPPGAAPGDARTMEDAAGCMRDLGTAPDASCVVLYAHVLNALHWSPMNVQRPPIDLDPVSMHGYALDTVWDYNRLLIRATPGFVEFNGPAGPHSQPHPGRLGADVALSPLVPPWATWYVSVDADSALPSGPTVTDAGAAPCLTMRTTLEHWETPNPNGPPTVLFEGRATRTVVTTPQGLGPLAGTPCPGATPGDVIEPRKVTTFGMPLQPLTTEAVVPADGVLVVRVEWFFHDTGAGAAYPMGLRFHVGPETPNRVVLALRDALVIERPALAGAGREAALHFDVRSPLGGYDIDAASIQVELLDQAGLPFGAVPGMGPAVVRYPFHHDPGEPGLRVAFPWDVQTAAIPPGVYEVQVSARNWQHTALARASMPFVVASDGTVIDGPAPVVFPEPTGAPPEPTDAAPLALSLTAGLGAVALLWFLTERRPA